MKVSCANKRQKHPVRIPGSKRWKRRRKARLRWLRNQHRQARLDQEIAEALETIY